MKLCVDWAFENKGGKAKNSKKIKQELVLIVAVTFAGLTKDHALTEVGILPST